MLTTAIRTELTQRISVQEQEGNLALFTWLAELQPQAKYRSCPRQISAGSLNML